MSSTLTDLHLTDLFDMGDLTRAVDDGFVRRQHHPDPALGLTIWNYTDVTQYQRHWTDVTLTCRGLITDASGRVVARPYAKFFNYGEARGLVIHLDAPALVTDKLDGSLGILYPDGDGYAIATRGSFASEQARHATRVWRERYAHRFAPAPGITYLFEIIYPGNRIVVDYNGLDDLVLLGGVEIATGTPIDAETIDWPGPKVTTFAYATLREALSAPPRPGAEGFVVRLPDADHVTVKIKQADYIALHRILTQVTARTVWEFCAVSACKHLIDRPKWWGSLLGMDPARAEQILDLGPDWLATLVDGVPDEFHAWLRSTIDGLHARVQELLAELTELAELARFVYGSDRKAMAAELLTHEHCGAIFHLLDGKDLTTYFWRHVYPEPGAPWVSGSEDA
ncbi:RNA ligase [Planomonospora sp. ID82291]|uniref:RNA ligase n=1 Tax=Planomonospora sp. ID82291 TaxID=2738136 RepID=UPI0018C3D4FD|nr:RNA ligase [Planomonospora sp. ID82291]MBG0818749.1 2'-5' RNA ligase [Planomonospora sp. ID82291]